MAGMRMAAKTTQTNNSRKCYQIVVNEVYCVEIVFMLEVFLNLFSPAINSCELHTQNVPSFDIRNKCVLCKRMHNGWYNFVSSDLWTFIFIFYQKRSECPAIITIRIDSYSHGMITIICKMLDKVNKIVAISMQPKFNIHFSYNFENLLKFPLEWFAN